jgi:hypothetical protein
MTDEIEVLAELIRKGCFVSVVQDRGIQLH